MIFKSCFSTEAPEWVGRGGTSVTCPTHPTCPDKLLFLVFEDCYKNLFKPFLLIYAFCFEGTCLKIVYSLFDHCNFLCYKFGVFFSHSEDSIILCLIATSTLCMCKLCPVFTESSHSPPCTHTHPTAAWPRAELPV